VVEIKPVWVIHRDSKYYFLGCNTSDVRFPNNITANYFLFVLLEKFNRNTTILFGKLLRLSRLSLKMVGI
jgi:hypothetical protein